MKPAGKNSFTKALLNWNTNINQRQMPWKGVKDPYKIWLSEIILQQTRVEQGWTYYQKFVSTFPTIKDLAKAPQATVFKLWEGLGYYSRCRNLIATAQFITNDLKGIFPDNYNDIVALKGIGPYTAAAIASFAYNLPYAVVDGNVYRLLARYFGIDIDISSNEGKKYFSQLAQQVLDKQQAGLYNQAIMDFGATICKPQLPNCKQCPLQKKCAAYSTNAIDKLPVKSKKIVVKHRWFNYFIITDGKSTLIQERIAKDIWQNLFEFPLVETSKQITSEKLFSMDEVKCLLGNTISKTNEPIYLIQKLSHQTIHATFIKITMKALPTLKGYKKVSIKKINEYAFPKTIALYLQKHLLA